MRLICGIVQLDGAPADATTLARMIAALSAPGLKAQVQQRVDGPAGLAVLDFSRETVLATLPIGPDGSWLAADLRADQPSGCLNDASDFTAVFTGLERWGLDLPDRLHGDFALAAWDPRQRRLRCARDIMGVRPLCYVYRPGKLLAFASLPRGLHASGVVAPRLDLVALGRRYVQAGIRESTTVFEDISWLPAGHSLEVTREGLRVHRAWRPEPGQVGTWRGSAEEAAATLRTLVEEAVSCRLPAAGPVAAHLSGGLDSSAVVVLAARRLRETGRKLHTFSQLARPESKVRDEREYVEAVLAQEPDIEWSPAYQPTPDETEVADPDLPLGGPGSWSGALICAAAASAGCEVLLSGAGGDEGATYNGAGLYAAVLRSGFLRTLPQELRAIARREGKSLLRVAVGRLLFPFLPDWTERLLPSKFGQTAPVLGREAALPFLRPPFAEQVRQTLPAQFEWKNRPRDRVQMLTESYLVPRADNWSILGARHGIAFSYPLADRRILDFTQSLPLNRLVDGGFARQPYRNAMAGILPESIRWRTSKFSPFPDALSNMALEASALRVRLELVRRSPAAREMFNLDAIGAELGRVYAAAAALEFAEAVARRS